MSGGLDVHCSRAQAAEDPRQLEIPIWNILRLCGDIPRVQQLVTTCRALPGKLKNVHGEWAHLNSGQHSAHERHTGADQIQNLCPLLIVAGASIPS